MNRAARPCSPKVRCHTGPRQSFCDLMFVEAILDKPSIDLPDCLDLIDRARPQHNTVCLEAFMFSALQFRLGLA